MKKSKISDTQIVKAIKEPEDVRSIADVSGELGINSQTLCNWKKIIQV